MPFLRYQYFYTKENSVIKVAPVNNGRIQYKITKSSNPDSKKP